jgi:hypothetical protein
LKEASILRFVHLFEEISLEEMRYAYMNPFVFCHDSVDIEFEIPGTFTLNSKVELESSLSEIRERFRCQIK